MRVGSSTQMSAGRMAVVSTGEKIDSLRAAGDTNQFNSVNEKNESDAKKQTEINVSVSAEDDVAASLSLSKSAVAMSKESAYSEPMVKDNSYNTVMALSANSSQKVRVGSAVYEIVGVADTDMSAGKITKEALLAKVRIQNRMEQAMMAQAANMSAANVMALLG